MHMRASAVRVKVGGNQGDLGGMHVVGCIIQDIGPYKGRLGSRGLIL